MRLTTASTLWTPPSSSELPPSSRRASLLRHPGRRARGPSPAERRRFPLTHLLTSAAPCRVIDDIRAKSYLYKPSTGKTRDINWIWDNGDFVFSCVQATQEEMQLWVDQSKAATGEPFSLDTKAWDPQGTLSDRRPISEPGGAFSCTSLGLHAALATNAVARSGLSAALGCTHRAVLHRATPTHTRTLSPQPSIALRREVMDVRVADSVLGPKAQHDSLDARVRARGAAWAAGTAAAEVAGGPRPKGEPTRPWMALKPCPLGPFPAPRLDNAFQDVPGRARQGFLLQSVVNCYRGLTPFTYDDPGPDYTTDYMQAR